MRSEVAIIATIVRSLKFHVYSISAKGMEYQELSPFYQKLNFSYLLMRLEDVAVELLLLDLILAGLHYTLEWRFMS